MLRRVEEVLPWTVTDVSLRPFKGMWSFNPSVHFDGSLWRCVLRCADYSMNGGVTVKSDRAKPGQTRTKNAMVIFDPASWRPIELYKMRERDDHPRASSGSVGYEDVRLFRTDSGGLQGIAAALHLRRSDGGDQVAEQVLLSLDEEYNVEEARPIRGSWSRSAQKNWAPFDHCEEPRFLYAIDQATMFGIDGELRGHDAQVRPSTRPRRPYRPGDRAVRRAKERADEAEDALHDRHRRRSRGDWSRPWPDVQVSGCDGLRGGTQLVRVGGDEWLGVGHAMRFLDGLKWYWHVFYLVDSWANVKAASDPLKLAPNGIEFAAGLAIDGDRAVVSFGVDDAECRLGETSLSAVLGILRPVESEP